MSILGASANLVVVVLIALVAYFFIRLGLGGKRRRFAHSAHARHDELVARMGDRFQVGDGSTFGLAEVAERVQAIAGQPMRDAKPPRGAPVIGSALAMTGFADDLDTLGRIEIGPVLHRSSEGGEELVLEHWWSSGHGDRRVIAARRVQGAHEPFTLETTVIEGELPAPLAGDARALVAELPGPARLRLAGGWLTVSAPGHVGQALSERLLARLAELDARLAAPAATSL